MKRVTVIRAVPLLALLVFIPLVLAQLSANMPSSASSDSATNLQQHMQENRQRGRLIQTLYQAESLAAQTGWTSDLARSAGEIWEQLGDVSQATTYWEIAAYLAPDDVSLTRHLVQIYLDLQRWPEANDTLLRLVESAPDDNRAHYNLGLLEAVFDPNGASEHLRLAARDVLYRDISFELLAIIGVGTMNSSTAMQVGLSLAGHDLWPYAELAFEQAAALGDPFPEALAYLGLARDKQGKDGGAAVNQAVAFAPDNPQVLYLRGLHLRTVFEYDASLNAFVGAMQADPANPAFAAELSTAYYLIGNIQDAETWLKTAVELSDNDPRFQDLLAAFYTSLENN
jgi:tetratricopeptide (TPR) repeat protein